VAKESHIDLSAIDGQLLDGLDYCRKVYDLFDHIQRQPEGRSRLRLRPSKIEKRLVEELLPLARYLQARYQAGRRIKVRWFSGSQPYDAILWSSGSHVKHGGKPRKVLVEITTSVHPNEYLTRQLLEQRGGSFGVKGIRREGKTGEIISEPYAVSGGEYAKDLAEADTRKTPRKSQQGLSPYDSVDR
jgi:hypothetical protein